MDGMEDSCSKGSDVTSTVSAKNICVEEEVKCPLFCLFIYEHHQRDEMKTTVNVTFIVT